ncbi:unnamed protein product [Rotaria sp. Silwood1]|nr:unnamed protein product [Rotaria sp. Silwood1]CAF1165119.1 unnamed protein product [Rotaria sp. Silwood1]CAF3478104.1 unnamed protein product [Rotaria sp. Silwood1]CAF4610481.1 unnamed protein product [Rotaria sp. Silwood1]
MSFPPHMPMMTPMPFFPPVAPMMIPPNMATPPPGIPPSTNGTPKTGENEKKNRLQATTTVFVGSISDRAPDIMIKRMLQHCGSVLNWKRVQGANGKLQAFGFCEYENPEGTLRCIRLLNGWQIQDKKLVVKVDAKTKVILDEYKRKKRHELAKKAANDTTAFKFIYEDDDDDDDDNKKKSNSTDTDGKKKSGEEGEIEEEEDDYIDDETRREDYTIKQSIETVMREYVREMNQRALEAKEQAARETQSTTIPQSLNPSIPSVPIPSNSTVNPISDVTSSNSTNPVTRRATDPAVSLDDEEGKRNLISNEIQMFRDRFKDEDTKMRNTEKERKDRYERERALQREKRAAEEAAASGNNKSSTKSPSSRHTSPPPPSSSSSRNRSSPRRDHSSSTSRRDRLSPNDDRYRSSSSRNNTSNSVRSRTGERRSSPPPLPSRYDRRSPISSSSRLYNRRSRTKSPISKNRASIEDDDETYERKKQEKRLREKEVRYRERLKTWEQRERKKEAEYESEKQRELDRLRDEEKKAKHLLAFFEDYNDETDDLNYYKGTALARCLKDREHEIEIDNRDRHREKDEIEELRQKLLLQDNIDDIELEIKRRLEKDEENIRKRLTDLIRTTSDETSEESDNEDEKTKKSLSKNLKDNIDVSNNLSIDLVNSSTDSLGQSSRITIKAEFPQNDIKLSPRHTSALGGAPITGTKLPSKRKLAVNEVFRDDQEGDSTNLLPKKSKLSAIPDQQTIVSQNSPKTSLPQVKDEPTNRISSSTTKSTPPVSNVNTNSTQSQEEKRQAVRKLIESIPTKKEDLFTYTLDWSLLDSNLMEKRIKPWVTKKIVEYIGEEEPTLTDFICSSIMSKKNADSILADIRVVLDDEAEVFVVKMWRLLVYEIEAKRHGLSK